MPGAAKTPAAGPGTRSGASAGAIGRNNGTNAACARVGERQISTGRCLFLGPRGHPSRRFGDKKVPERYRFCTVLAVSSGFLGIYGFEQRFSVPDKTPKPWGAGFTGILHPA